MSEETHIMNVKNQDIDRYIVGIQYTTYTSYGLKYTAHKTYEVDAIDIENAKEIVLAQCEGIDPKHISACTKIHLKF